MLVFVNVAVKMHRIKMIKYNPMSTLAPLQRVLHVEARTVLNSEPRDYPLHYVNLLASSHCDDKLFAGRPTQLTRWPHSAVR